MKLWLNNILACPDDRAFPLKLKIFKWDTPQEEFDKLLIAYNNRFLLNFKNEKNPKEIQVLDTNVYDENFKISNELESKVLNENKRLTGKIDFRNMINIFVEEEKLKIKDYNMVSPSSVKEYLEYYTKFFKEMKEFEDVSENESSKKLLELAKISISKKISKFADTWSNEKIGSLNKKDSEIIDEVLDLLNPIFQELLFVNYFLYLMEIEQGLLICPKCNRWYPIIQTIPRLFPKTMERQEMDFKFKEEWDAKFPSDVL